MLRLRQIIKNRPLCPKIAKADSFCERLRANLTAGAVRMDPKELLHLVNTPLEMYLLGDSAASVSIDNRQQNIQNIKLDVINQVVGRIVLEEELAWTYQDQIFVCNILRKLGITEVSQFIRQVHESRQEYRGVSRLIGLYRENLEKLVRAGAEAGLSGRQEVFDSQKESTWKKEGDWYLHREIYRRLDTQNVYSQVSSLYRNQGQPAYIPDHREFAMAEQVRVGDTLLLSQLRESGTHRVETVLESYINPYELEPEEGALKSEGQIMTRLAETILFHLLERTNIGMTREYSSGNTSRVDIRSMFFQAAADSINRFSVYQKEHRVYGRFYRQEIQSVSMANKKEMQILSEFSGSYIMDKDSLTETVTQNHEGGATMLHFHDGSAPEMEPAALVRLEADYLTETTVGRETEARKEKNKEREITDAAAINYDSLTEHITQDFRSRINLTLPREPLLSEGEAERTVDGETFTVEKTVLEVWQDKAAKAVSPGDREKNTMELKLESGIESEQSLPAGKVSETVLEHKKGSTPIPLYGEILRLQTLRQELIQGGQAHVLYEKWQEKQEHLPSDGGVALWQELSQTTEETALHFHMEQLETGMFFNQESNSWISEGERTSQEWDKGQIQSNSLTLKQRLDLVNEHNVKAKQMLDQSAIQVKTIESQIIPDMERTRSESLKFLQNQNQTADFFSPSQEEPVYEIQGERKEAFSEKAVPSFANVDEMTRYVLEQVRDYQNGESVAAVKPVAMEQVEADMKELRREQEPVSDRPPVLIGMVREAEAAAGEMIENIRESTGAGDRTEIPSIHIREAVSMFHKETAQSAAEEILEEWSSRLEHQRQSESINVLQETENKNSVRKSPELSRTIDQNSSEIQELIEKGIQKQIGAISDKVCGKLEKRLQQERARRGK